jgi:hypothetical protein
MKTEINQTWTVCGNDTTGIYIREGKKGKVICELLDNENALLDDIAEAKANAAFITTACNNHYALLSALKTLLSSYRADFKNITGAELNNTESVLKALSAIKASEQA